TGFDVHDDRLVGSVIDGEDVHIGQADEQLAHARSVGLHRGSGTIDWCRNRRFLEPLCHARWTPSYALTPPRPRSDPKRPEIPIELVRFAGIRVASPPTAAEREEHRAMTNPEWGFETRQIHAGQEPDPATQS